jgi:hypothetical protein
MVKMKSYEYLRYPGAVQGIKNDLNNEHSALCTWLKAGAISALSSEG